MNEFMVGVLTGIVAVLCVAFGYWLSYVSEEDEDYD